MALTKRNTWTAVAAIVGVLAGTGCTVSPTPVYPVNAPQTTAGRTFCQELTESGHDLSTLQSSFGWGLTIAALGALTTGTILTAANAGEEGTTTGRVAGMALTTGGVALVPLAYGSFSRADAATKLGVAANLALSQNSFEDKDAYDACVAAKADWLSSRSESNAFAIQALKKAEEAKKDTPPAPAANPNPGENPSELPGDKPSDGANTPEGGSPPKPPE